MIESTDLWKAWPLGYLPKRGVLTVGGWTCLEAPVDSQEGTSGWVRAAPDPDGLTELGLLDGMPDARVNRGALLPCVDPLDTATWACLLQDLAEALNTRLAREAKERGHEPWTLFTERGLYLEHWDGGPPYNVKLVCAGGCSYGWAVQDESRETAVKPWGRYPSWRKAVSAQLVQLRIFEREQEPPHEL